MSDASREEDAHPQAGELWRGQQQTKSRGKAGRGAFGEAKSCKPEKNNAAKARGKRAHIHRRGSCRHNSVVGFKITLDRQQDERDYSRYLVIHLNEGERVGD